MQKVVVIVGPTASGKTKLSIELAKKLNGEIISADSMQIYREMDIGTAKPTIEEQENVQHYMIDVVLPNQRYSVSDYTKQAQKHIETILEKKKMPIIVGGTGLYIDSLINEIEFIEQPTNFEYRNELEKIANGQGLQKLYQMAKEIDYEATEKISENDKKRIIRILEIYEQTGKTKTQLDMESRRKELKFDYKVFGINMNRQELYNRINLRVDKMFEQGLIEEVKNIYVKYNEFPTSMQGIGYKEVVEYLKNNITKEEMIEKIKQESRRYAKRQLTWFRKNKEIKWLDGEQSLIENINIILENL